MSLTDFFARLRSSGFHLGLEPEFSGIELLATVKPEEQPRALRENIDQFFRGRGFHVLTKIIQWASEQNQPDVTEIFHQLAVFIRTIPPDEFLSDPENARLPRSAILRDMLRIANESNSFMVNKFIRFHLTYLDANFFLFLSESLRNARMRGETPTVEILTGLGKTVATQRVQHGLPCWFSGLYLR